MDNLTYSSRSKLESFLDCPRLGYIRYLWDGRGITKRAASVYLSTGAYTHIGLQRIFENVKFYGQVHDNQVDEAVKLAIDAYNKEIQIRGFDLEEGEDKANEQYIIAEQCALVEGFIRSFAIRVLPDLLNRFKVVDVEREEIVIDGNLVMQGRIDVILEEITTNDLYIVSFKTAAQWDRRQEKSNEHDNQGLSETWILEHRLKQENIVIDKIANGIESIHGLEGLNISTQVLISINPKIITAAKKFKEYTTKFKKNEKIMGVIMIYLLKGKRYESSSQAGRWEQHSPLIRAYRKLVGTEYEYAPSLYYNNPANKSGKGRLGKGWEPFTVWDCEEVGFTKGWIERLADPNINVGMGEDVIANSYKIPAPYFRNQEHIDSWVRQSRAKEHEIEIAVKQVNNAVMNGMPLSIALDYDFGQRRKGCHYPVDCEMLDICYNSEVFNDPIGSGKFIYRKPHHKAELEEHEKLYNISSNIRTEESKKNMQGTSNSPKESSSKGEGKRNTSEEIGILDEEVIINE